MTSPRAAAQVHSRQRIRRGSSPRDSDAAGRQSLTRQSGQRTRLRESGSSAGPMAARRRSIGSAGASWPIEATTRRSSSRGMRVVAEAMLSSAPAESRMRSRADVAVLDTSTSSAPDDRQVLALPSSDLSRPADGSNARPPGASGPMRASCSRIAGLTRMPAARVALPMQRCRRPSADTAPVRALGSAKRSRGWGGPDDPDRGKGVARAERSLERKQSWRAAAAHAWMWAKPGAAGAGIIVSSGQPDAVASKHSARFAGTRSVG